MREKFTTNSRGAIRRPVPDRELGLAGERLETILERVASSKDSFAAGSVAALTVTFAAALGASAARAGPDGDSAGLAAQADTLEISAMRLASRNHDEYGAVRAALAETVTGADGRIGRTLEETLETLQVIARDATATAELAVQIADSTGPASRPEAVMAAVLADAATRAVSSLVDTNLLSTADHPVREVVSAELKASGEAGKRAIAWEGS
ncbi:MAG: cyclodeaminase/cyclohydrolase family protein [Solirubrobacterales bacterium]